MTIETFEINGKDYVWYNYTEPLDVLNASDLNNAQSNIATIRSILIDKGYNVSEISTERAIVATPYIDVIDKLNAIEYNLDVLDETVAKSIYYKESYKAVEGGKAHNKEQIWRWFQVLNDAFDIAIGKKGMWGYLLCSDGYPTIKGKRLMVRGDLIG